MIELKEKSFVGVYILGDRRKTPSNRRESKTAEGFR